MVTRPQQLVLGGAWGLSVAGLLFAAACSSAQVPSPEDVARAYARAAEAGDDRAMYALLSRSSQKELGREGVEELMQISRVELAQRGRAFAHSSLEQEAQAAVPYEDGQVVTLSLDDGEFRLESASALPAGAKTPTQALRELRAALSRRSHAALLSVLTEASAHDLESELVSLVDALERPEELHIDVRGDRATVELREGHVIELRRERGFWRVEDFR